MGNDNLPAKRPDDPTSDPGLPRRIMAWAASIAPLAISQVDAASKKYAAHKARLATIEAWKSGYVVEVTASARAKEKLLEKLAQAKDEAELAMVRNTLDSVDRHIRTLHVQSAALDYLHQLPPPTRAVAEDAIPEPHWLDRFIELSKSRNEDWRKDLLAKTLAIETNEPGIFSERALWAIGTMSAPTFHAFSHFLDASCRLDREPFIPGELGSFVEAEVPNCILPRLNRYGFLLTILVEEGLVYSPGSAVSKELAPGERHQVSCGDQRISFVARSKQNIHGVLLTTLGAALSRLYSPAPTPLAMARYAELVAHLQASGHEMGPPEQVQGQMR